MEKETITKFGKDYYLLGIRKEDNKKIWLERASFNCNWYWGIGYIEVFNENYTDIEEHTHFDALFFNGNEYDNFKNYFSDTTINDEEILKILELMKNVYEKRHYSDILYSRSKNKDKNIFKIANHDENDYEYVFTNQRTIPFFLETIYKILRNKKVTF